MKGNWHFIRRIRYTKTYMKNLKLYAPIVLRYSMALVIIWFGIQQLVNTADFMAYVPESAARITHLDITTLVYINSIFELVFGFLLLIGWKIRIVGVLLALHLFDIMYVVGYGEIGVRDFGLAMATLSVAMQGADMFSIDKATA